MALLNNSCLIVNEPQLVGRKTEILLLQQALETAKNGRESVIIVSGEAGAGKTKLANEFLNLAKKSGVVTLEGWCLSEIGIAYFPFIEAFSTYFSSNACSCDDVEVNSWLKGSVQPGPSGPVELSSETWKDLTFAAVRKALTKICSKSPAILFLDDLQWADSATLALLHYIARSMYSQRLVIVATYRTEQLKQSQALTEMLRSIKRENNCREISLGGLDSANITFLAQNMIGGNISSAFSEKLNKDSQGNPLFIVEAIRMLCENNNLTKKEDEWRLAVESLGIPAKIKDIILSRVSKLRPEQKKTLELASVLGTHFDPELLADLFGRDTLSVLEELDEISNSLSLVICEGTRYRFYYGKVCDAYLRRNCSGY